MQFSVACSLWCNASCVRVTQVLEHRLQLLVCSATIWRLEGCYHMRAQLGLPIVAIEVTIYKRFSNNRPCLHQGALSGKYLRIAAGR